MFGFSLVKTKKLDALYEHAAELVVMNQRLETQNRRLKQFCNSMAEKLEQNNIRFPEWWKLGL